MSQILSVSPYAIRIIMYVITVPDRYRQTDRRHAISQKLGLHCTPAALVALYKQPVLEYGLVLV